MFTTKDQTIAPPDLHIPPSTQTVDVSIINTTSTIHGAKTTDFFGPHIKGHDWLAVPVFSFLIQHHGSDGTRTLLFDLGIRKDWWNSAPAVVDHLQSIKPPWKLDTQKSVREILKESNKIHPNAIEAIIWSHHHFDHTGDVSSFPPSTALIVGPGVTETLLPGYPDNPNSTLLKSEYANRSLIELDFATGISPSATINPSTPLSIGHLPAIDYFNDGSFYLLNTPGHAQGHICALARVRCGNVGKKDSFILLAGDAVHHVGELRPSHWLGIPERLSRAFESLDGDGDIDVSPRGQSMDRDGIDGNIFAKLLPQGELDGGGGSLGSFYRPAGSCACRVLSRLGGSRAAESGGGEEPQWHLDPNEAVCTVRKLQEFDVQDNIFVMAAHDESLLDVVDFFPAGLNGFVEKGWARRARWRFLADFVDGVDGVSEEDRGWLKGGVVRKDWGVVGGGCV